MLSKLHCYLVLKFLQIKMVGHFLRSLSRALLQFEAVYVTPLWRKPPRPELIPIMVQSASAQLESAMQGTGGSFDINSIFDGFLWGAPTYRRSVEKREMRKYGAENWSTGRKLIPIRKDLKTCYTCGHYHEDGRLCRKLRTNLVIITVFIFISECFYRLANCYAKIREETKAMQEKMVNELGLEPIDKDVVIMYDGEKHEHDDEFFQVLLELPRIYHPGSTFTFALNRARKSSRWRSLVRRGSVRTFYRKLARLSNKALAVKQLLSNLTIWDDLFISQSKRIVFLDH